MKTLIRTLTILMITGLTHICTYAQSPITVDINGLYFGETYTKAHVIDKLGQPASYKSTPNDSGDAIDEVFRYDNAFFAFIENGEFNRFSIKNPTYKLFNGSVKIGDPLSKIQNLSGTTYIPGTNRSKLVINNADYSLSFEHTNGIIVSISASIPN